VSSIWSPLTRRRWWNHIGDDTALCGITSAMIRRQPDHLNCPFPCPPFIPSPLKPTPLASPHPACPWAMCKQDKQVRPCLCYSASKQPRQARQERAGGGLVRSHGPWCYETPVPTQHQTPLHRRWQVETLCSKTSFPCVDESTIQNT